MNDDTKAQVALLLSMLRRSEERLAALRGDSRETPFHDAAIRTFESDIASLKGSLFDALRSTIEAMEGGR